jgi:heme O synthase-like polyprenyltransferase
MTQSAYLVLALRILLVIMWLPMPVWAAAVAVDHPFKRIDFPVLALAFGLSTLSGATALVWRLDQELRRAVDGKMPRPFLFAASNLLGSWTAGTLAWVGSQGLEQSIWVTLAFVIAVSFGGARFLEKVSEKYADKVMPP